MNRLLILVSLFAILSCQKGKSGDTANSSESLAANQLAVSVGTCGFTGVVNRPCVSVRVCTPGTSNCQTIPNVMLDTGSYGLRLFASVVTVPLTQNMDPSGNPIAECAQFGAADTWGPVQTAEIFLSGEPGVTLPVQVINSSYATVPSNCTGLATAPQSSGFNGILGVGLETEDCGPNCVGNAGVGMYFSCPAGAQCASIAMPLNQQVINPVSALPVDNNGLLLQLPTVPLGGIAATSGYLYLGIGTQTNNSPGSATAYAADGNGDFVTVFNGATYSTSYIDSGSDGYFFLPPSGLTVCSSGEFAGVLCPATAVALSATQSGAGQSQGMNVNFSISNGQTEITDGEAAMNDFGAANQGQAFTWGLPFFFGRSVFVGINGTSSTLGTGPYWAW